ncbi:MAG: hypothetical protein GY811_06070 [Myxococcales bacterium]|nr:hypothetical protein [Myxococcales bacterium]
MTSDQAATAILDLMNKDYIEAYNSSDEPTLFVNWMLAPFRNAFSTKEFSVVVADTHEILGNEPGNFQPQG